MLCGGFAERFLLPLRVLMSTSSIRFMTQQFFKNSSTPRTYQENRGSMLWNDLFSDRYIQNAAYWKIANVELGYNFPNKWFKGVVTGARVYVSAQNLYTFTKYKGYNVDYAGGLYTPGFNWCSYPSARSFMAGLLFSF